MIEGSWKIIRGNPSRYVKMWLWRCFWLYGWEPLMASPHLAKFGGHRDCGSRDMFLVVEEQDSICSFNSTIIISSKVRGMLCLYIQKFTIKIALPKSYVSASNEYSTILVACILGDKWWTICKKNFVSHSKKGKKKKKEKKDNKKGKCKAFCCSKKSKMPSHFGKALRRILTKAQRNNCTESRYILPECSSIRERRKKYSTVITNTCTSGYTSFYSYTLHCT